MLARYASLDALIAAGNYKHPYDFLEISIAGWEELRRVEININLKVELIPLEKPEASAEVLKSLFAPEYKRRPLCFPELLAFGACYPWVQEDFEIAGIGKVLRKNDGSGVYPCLGYHPERMERYVESHPDGMAWMEQTRIAVAILE